VDFPITLAANTPNDGTEDIVVPAAGTELARVEVQSVGNIFFDMSNASFTIISTPTGVGDLAAEAVSLSVQPNPFTYGTAVTFAVSRPGPVEIGVYDAAGRRVATLTNGVRDAGTHTVEWAGRDANGNTVAPGIYFVRMESTEGVQTTRSLLLR
jgi:hypothetical protein